MSEHEGDSCFFEWGGVEGIAFKEFVDNDEDFTIYLSWLRNIKIIEMIGRQEYLLAMDIDQIRAYVKQLNLSNNDSFFKVFYQGRFIGTFKVGHIDWRLKCADLGIMIGDLNYQKRGLSVKIMNLGIEYSFHVLGLRRLTGGCYAENVAMCKCFEACGFRLEGRERESLILRDRYTDHVSYGLLKKDALNYPEFPGKSGSTLTGGPTATP